MKAGRPQVVIVQRIVPKYRKPVFDALAARVPLVVLHTQLPGSIAQTTGPWSRVVSHWQYGRSETNVWLNVMGQIWKLRPKVLIHEAAPGIASLMPTILLCRLLGIKVALWGHGYNHKAGFDPKTDRKARFRLWLLRQADALLLYGKQAKEVLAPWLPGKPMFVATNTLNTPLLFQIADELRQQGREEVRKRLGFGPGRHLIYTGRLLADKGAIELVRIMQHLTEAGVPATLHVVGDGPARADMEEAIQAAGLSDRFVLHGAIYDEHQLGRLLYACEAFVMPGYLGLNVNHALSYECPVFSYRQGPKGPWHSPEAEHVIEGQTGYLSAPFDTVALAQNLMHYLNDAGLQQRIQQTIYGYSRQHLALENMTDAMVQLVEELSGE